MKQKTVAWLLWKLDEIAFHRAQAAHLLKGRDAWVAAGPGDVRGQHAARSSARAEHIYNELCDDQDVEPIRAICESEGSPPNAQCVKRLRGRLSIAMNRGLDAIDAMPLSEFARHLRRLVAGKRLEEHGDHAITVASWSDLAIGINERYDLWALSPAPQIGARFRKNDAVPLQLKGEQWRILLESLAKSADGMSVGVGDLAAQLDAPKPESRRADSRARPGAINAATIAEVGGRQFDPARKRVSRIISDLARKLREQVRAEHNPKGSALRLDGGVVRAGFRVGFVVCDEEGHQFFGRKTGR